jgi:glycerol-3-phosphate dehydrogenase (NAD(P)+)
MPVSATVAAVLAGRLDVAQAVGRLMERPRRSE